MGITTTTTTFHSFPVVVVAPTRVSLGDDVMENVVPFSYYSSFIHIFYCRRSFVCFIIFCFKFTFFFWGVVPAIQC
jgi:hypothetical protein